MKSLKTPKGGNQNQYIEEEQTTQRQKKKNKQRSAKHTRGELRYSGRVGSSCSTSGTGCVNLVTNR